MFRPLTGNCRLDGFLSVNPTKGDLSAGHSMMERFKGPIIRERFLFRALFQQLAFCGW